MKPGPVTKLDMINKTTSKKSDVDFMSANCDVIVFFRIFGQSGAVRKPDSRYRVCKVMFSVTVTFFSYKKSKQN